jgi:hypothetical protein
MFPICSMMGDGNSLKCRPGCHHHGTLPKDKLLVCMARPSGYATLWTKLFKVHSHLVLRTLVLCPLTPS